MRKPTPRLLARLLTPLIGLACLAAATPARGGIYAEFLMGFPQSDTGGVDDADTANVSFDLDSGESFHIAVGLDGGLLRSELELAFRDVDGITLQTSPPSANSANGDLDSLSLMSNLYVDIPVIATDLEFFVGGGVGVVQYDGQITGTGTLANNDLDGTKYALAYQLRGGLAYKLTANLSLTAGYRYFVTNDFNFGDASFDSVAQQSVDVGVRLSF